MNADPRIRERLEQAAQYVRIDTRRGLDDVHGSVARRRTIRKATAFAVAGILGLLVVGIVWQLRSLGDRGFRPGQGVRPTGRIAYGRTTASLDRDLFVLDVVSGQASAMEAGTGLPTSAQWSPDGSSIAFTLEESGGESYAIVVVEADGTNPVRILEVGKALGTPGPDLISLSWSSDGSRIAYSGRAVGRGRTILIVNSDGTGQPVVLDGHWEAVSWSPDGERLLVVGWPQTDVDAGQFDLYSVRLDGSEPIQLTDDELIERQPAWSPDGTRIVFSKSGGEFEDPDWDQDVYVMEADGSNVRRLTEWEGLDFFPAWSPDGSWIAFASDRDATAERQRANRSGTVLFGGLSMYVMRSDGSGVVRLLDGGDRALYPLSWTF